MASSPTKRRTKAKPVPHRLAVYRAICDLSPAAYGPLARMIMSAANAEREDRTPRRKQRHHAPGTVHNIGKPVIDIDADATRPVA